jgi:hypothetical protein
MLFRYPEASGAQASKEVSLIIKSNATARSSCRFRENYDARIDKVDQRALNLILILKKSSKPIIPLSSLVSPFLNLLHLLLREWEG